jgi:hypothetical protein
VTPPAPHDTTSHDIAWHTENTRHAHTPRPHLAAATDDRFAWHPPTRLVAHLGRDQQWRFLDVNPGDEPLAPIQVAQLEPLGQPEVTR